MPFAFYHAASVLAEGERYLCVARFEDSPRPAPEVLAERLEDAGFDTDHFLALGPDMLGGHIEPDEEGMYVQDAMDAAAAVGATGLAVGQASADGGLVDEGTVDWWKRAAAALAVPGVILKVDDPKGPIIPDKKEFLLTWGPLLLGLASLGIAFYVAFVRGKG